MVLGHVGRRNEQHRLGNEAQLGDRPGPAARDDQIGRGVGVVHAVDESPLPDVRGGVRGQKGLHFALVVLARLPDHLHGGLAVRPDDPCLHHLVQRPRAERPANHQDHRKIRRQPVIFQRLGAVGALLRKAAPQGIARQDDLRRREKAFHAFVGRADAPRALREDFIRHARIGVLLLNHGRHAHPLRGPQHRSAGIAAEAHHGVGPEVADDPLRHPDALHRLERHRQVAPVQPPLKARDRQAHDAVAQRRDLLHLHLALGPDEENLHPVAETPFQGLGHSHGRVDMASGSTSGKNDAFHRI